MDELERVREQIKRVAAGERVTVDQPPAYSGWVPVLDSEINRITSEALQDVSGQPIVYRYTHGGLECGVLLGRFPHLQAVSIGPEVLGAHTTKERVNVVSVKRYYNLLKTIVGKVATMQE